MLDLAGKPRKIRRAEFRQITKMLFECKSDIEIMNELGLPQRTLTRYKSQIYQEYADKFAEERMSNVGFYTTQLHDRLTRYLKVLESKLDSCQGKDVAALAQVITDIAKTIFDLELQKLEILDTVKTLANKVRSYVSIQELNKDNNTNDVDISTSKE